MCHLLPSPTGVWSLRPLESCPPYSVRADRCHHQCCALVKALAYVWRTTLRNSKLDMGIYSSHPSLGDIRTKSSGGFRSQQDCFEADSVLGKQASWWPCPETCQTEPAVQSRPYSGASPPPKSSAARVAQAINTYRPGSKKRRATQRRHPSQMPGPPGKRWDAAPTSTTPPPSPSPATPRRRHSTVLAMGTLPSPSRTCPMVLIAEPTFFADSFRYSLPPYTTTPQQVPGPLRRESASHHMVLRTTSAR